MKKSLILAAALFAVTSAFAADPEPGFELKLSRNQYYGTIVFKIQAVENNVKVHNVVINRGNCKIAPGTQAELDRGLTLKFGETYMGFSNNCTPADAKEVVVEAGPGKWTFKY